MKDSRILVRTPVTLRNDFKAWAATQDKTMSDVIREFIESKVRTTNA